MTAIPRNQWLTIKDQSLAVYTRKAGFDLAIYDQYTETVREELRKCAIKEAIKGIRDKFEEDKYIDICDVKQGVYVISLSAPLTIKYKKKPSPAIYVGMGNIMGRIETHFKRSLFDFMQSLSGANFDFSFSWPERKSDEDYYKHVEWQMLEYFSENYGGLSDKKRFPILNKNAGSERAIEDAKDWWKTPMQNTGKKLRWALTPTPQSKFAALE